MKDEYIFIHDYEGFEGDTRKTVVEASGSSLPEMLSAFKDFLAGCGFQVQHGEIEFVEEEPALLPSIEEEEEEVVNLCGCEACKTAERLNGGQ